MQSVGDKMVAGDVYVFEGDLVVGVVGGLKFQKIPRSLLNTLLKPTSVDKAPTSSRPSESRNVVKSSVSSTSNEHIKIPTAVDFLRPTNKPSVSSNGVTSRAMVIIAGCRSI